VPLARSWAKPRLGIPFTPSQHHLTSATLALALPR
jgi:hypothetical protein